MLYNVENELNSLFDRIKFVFKFDNFGRILAVARLLPIADFDLSLDGLVPMRDPRPMNVPQLNNI
jgi:hypothetical protein